MRGPEGFADRMVMPREISRAGSICPPEDYYLPAAEEVTERMKQSGEFAWNEELWQNEISNAIAKEVRKAVERKKPEAKQ